MTTSVKINGTDYIVPEVNFNAVCDLAERGVDVMSIRNTVKKNPVGVLRGIAAWIMGVDEETAGDEVQEHILNGGAADDIFIAFTKVMEESNFIKALAANPKNGEEGATKKRAKKTTTEA